MMQATSGQHDVIDGESQQARNHKVGPLNRINLEFELSVETRHRRQIDEVREAKWVTIVAKVEPPDERGWFRVVAYSVSPSCDAEQP